MLADEMGDKNAKRVMNLGQFKEAAPSAPSQAELGSGSRAATSSNPDSEKTAEEHKHEIWVKNLWHNISDQHDYLGEQQKEAGEKTTQEQKPQDEEPEKASGSG